MEVVQVKIGVQGVVMSSFRIRVGLNRGRGPVDFKSLSVLTEEINVFLFHLGQDAGLAPDANRWMATEVADGSFLSTAEPQLETSPEVLRLLEEMVAAVVRGDANAAQKCGVREQTKLHYAALAKKADNTHVPVDFGLYELSQRKEPIWFRVSTEKALQLTESIAPFIDYMGALQGVIHAWFKESDDSHFQLREASQAQLINCYYKPDHYADILRAVARKDERIHVAGLVRASRVDKRIESVRVTKIRNAVDFSDADFERFFGCAPGLTGELDSVSYIERNRQRDA